MTTGMFECPTCKAVQMLIGLVHTQVITCLKCKKTWVYKESPYAPTEEDSAARQRHREEIDNRSDRLRQSVGISLSNDSEGEDI